MLPPGTLDAMVSKKMKHLRIELLHSTSMVLCRLVRFSKCSTDIFSCIFMCPSDSSLVVNSMQDGV